MEARAEIIAPQVLLFEIELREGMGAVHDRLDPFRARHFADRFHGCDLARDVNLVRDQNQPRPVGDSFLKSRRELVEVLRRDRDLDQLELQVFALLPLPERRQHPRVILGRGQDFVTGLEVHPH